MPPKTIIVGSGLVGSLWAYVLKQRGYDVEVFEKKPDPQNVQAPAGRSINLVITSRGLHALKIAGLIENILPLTVPVYGREIHPQVGETLFQPYGRDRSECNYSISRWELNKALIRACDGAQVKIHFEHDVERLDLEKKQLSFRTPSGLIVKKYDRLFATDGAGSNIRKSLIVQRPQEFAETIDWLTSDYKEVNMPPTANGEPALAKEALHIWPRGTHMMMGLANGDNSFTMTLYLPKKDHPFAFENLKTPKQVANLFRNEFGDAVPLLPRHTQEFLENPQGKLATVRLNKWIYEDSVALLGDAAHAIVPFFGQGMNLGFEDCTTLLRLFDESKHDWSKTFAQYNATQRPNANAIAEMALENFVEMRDKVGDAEFQFKKKLESLIEKEFPQLYRSRYGLITYTLTPYAVAQRAGVKQSQILNRIAKNLKSPDDFDRRLTEKILETEYAPWSEQNKIQNSSFCRSSK